jgi:hypothetical protein
LGKLGVLDNPQKGRIPSEFDRQLEELGIRKDGRLIRLDSPHSLFLLEPLNETVSFSKLREGESYEGSPPLGEPKQFGSRFPEC